MADEITIPEDMAAMMAEAERTLDAQSDAFELCPELKEIRNQLLQETASLFQRWYQLGALAKLVSEGHSRRVQ